MDWKKLGKKLLFPPVWLMVLLVIVSAVALATVFLKGWSQTFVAYISYAVSFYTLCVVCIYCALVLPKQYAAIKQRIYDNPLGNRYMTDRVFRVHISLTVSFAISMLYALITIVCIEIIQLVTLLGSLDVDDLILNMIGVVIGYLIYRLAARLLKGTTHE